MQFTKRLLTGILVSSLAVVSSTFAISSDGGPIQTADAIKKASQFPEVKYQSVTDTEKKNYELQKQQMQTKLESMKWELELKKKTLSTSFEEEKKQLMSSCEAKKKAIYDEFNWLSEEEKKAQKATLEEKMKAVRADCEAQKKKLQARMEEKMKALKSELETQNKTLQSDMEAKKKTMEKEWEGKKQDMEAKKKELYAQKEARVKELMSTCESSIKALWEKYKALSSDASAEERASITEQYNTLKSDCEAKKKAIYADIEAQVKTLMGQKGNSWYKDSTQTRDKEKVKQELKDKLRKVTWTASTMTSEEMTQCKATYDTLRTEREANSKARKEARATFWEANKSSAKDIFAVEDREDVKDILDSMRLQIRLVERKYAKSLVWTSSVAQSTEYALWVIDTIAQRTRTDLAEYVQDGKQDQFTTFRDAFLAVLKSNKSSLLTMMASHAQITKWLSSTCKKKVAVTMTQSDTLDRQTQSQLYSMLSWRGESVNKEKKPVESTDKQPLPQSSTQ